MPVGVPSIIGDAIDGSEAGLAVVDQQLHELRLLVLHQMHPEHRRSSQVEEERNGGLFRKKIGCQAKWHPSSITHALSE